MVFSNYPLTVPHFTVWYCLSGPNCWLNDVACYTEQIQLILIQLLCYFPKVMVPPMSHGSQSRAAASVIVVYRAPGLRFSLQVTGFVRIKAESLAAPAESAGLSYRPLRMCVCVCVVLGVEVFYSTCRVCEISFVLVRSVKWVQGLYIKLICAGHAENCC